MIPDFDMSDEKIFSLEKLAQEIRSDNLPIFIWGYALTATVVSKTLERIGIKITGHVTDKAGVNKEGVISKEELIKNYPRYSLVRGFESLTWVNDEKIKSLWAGCQKVYTVPNPYDNTCYETITTEYYLSNKNKFDEVYDNLADDFSKKSLLAYIKSKVLRQQYPLLHLMVKPQYFFTPSPWNYNDSDVMFDCGAFDGDSIFDFVAFRGDYGYGKIIACEPDPSTFEKLKENLRTRNVKNVVALNVGLGEEKTSLKFNAQTAVTSGFSSTGNLEIPVDTIDNIERLTGGGITIIKMDIEGFEMSALRGAEQTIIKNRPVLAISAYHKRADVFSIYQYINGIVQCYRYFFRCHTTAACDAVLYAAPVERCT